MSGRWPPIIIALFVLVCAVGAQTPAGHSALAAAGLFEKPVPVTELAFSAPGALPNTLPAPTAKVSVSFTVRNDSANPRSYDWSVVVVHSGVSSVKATGAVATAAQGRATVESSVVPECTGGRAQIVVRLASLDQAISFWMTCPPAPAPAKAKASK